MILRPFSPMMCGLQVECSGNGGDVCNLLSASGVGVRVVGSVRGVSVGTDTTLVTAVVE